jgi:Cu/Ag efflux protein CusF
MTTRRFILLLVTACLIGTFALAQPKAKGKSHTLHGKVTEVGATSLTVDHEKVEGYMDAMVMAYKVDKPESLKGLKKGDMIMATVYDGDYTLYDIKLMPNDIKNAPPPPPKK